MDDAFEEENKSGQGEEGEAHYANFLEVGHNVSEFLLRFGQQDGSARIITRLYTTPAHALSFCDLLCDSVAQYERKFGPIRRLTPRDPGDRP